MIIDMSAQCMPCQKISAEIEKQYGLQINASTVYYWRLKFREQIVKAQGDMLASAKATQPLASLEYRLKQYRANIKRELRKIEPDGRVINDAIKNAGEEIRAMELFRLRETESLLKQSLLTKPAEDTSGIDQVISMVERRYIIAKEHRKENYAIMQKVDWARIDPPSTAMPEETPEPGEDE